MPLLPTANTKPEIVRQIHAALEANEADNRRQQMGLSEIGGCERFLWAKWNRAEPVDPPTTDVLAIFDTGHALEEMVLRWLEWAGYEIFDAQADLVMDLGDDLVVLGHADGFTKLGGDVVLVEIKTAKSTRFAELKAKGYRAWNEAYYDQVQAYLGASGEQIALVVVVCKDNSELWVEKLRFDPDRYEALRAKARRILTAEAAPERPYKSQYTAPCRFCSLAEKCWGPEWEVKFDE